MAEITQKNGDTPYCNTGYLDTRKTSIELPENGLRALVDWCSVTIKSMSTFEDSLAVLNLPSEKFEIRENGFNGYLHSAVYGDIMVCWGTPVGALNMGIHINLSGSACRQYESEFDLDMDWSNFFALILNFEHKFTRLDIAIDDFKGYFTIRQMYLKAKKGHMTVKKVKKARYFEEFDIDTGFTSGETLYIGKCNQIFRFYDKYGERKSKGLEVYSNVDVWNRYEIQLRDELATTAAKVLAYDNYELGEFAMGILKDKIDFKIPNKTDSNKSRWKSCKWWTDFLDEVQGIQLTQIASDPTIPKIKNWIDRQVDKSLAVLNEAFDNDPLLLSYVISKGKEKMSKRDFQMIEDFRKHPEMKEEFIEAMTEYMYESSSDISSFNSNKDKEERARYFVESADNASVHAVITKTGVEKIDETSSVKDIMIVVRSLSKYFAANISELPKKQISLGSITKAVGSYYSLSHEQIFKVQNKISESSFNYFQDFVSREYSLTLFSRTPKGFIYKQKNSDMSPQH